MHELYALLCYVLPEVIADAAAFEKGFAIGGQVDQRVLLQVRTSTPPPPDSFWSA